MFLRLMLFIPMIRQFMLLDVSRKADGSETHDMSQDTGFIDLIDQVRYAMSYGLIPLSSSTPKYTMFTLPLLHGRGAKTIRRRTLGWWASFTVDEDNKWKSGWSATYYVSIDAEFAISFTDQNGRESPLETRSIMQVLREEQLWREGLASLLRKTS